MSAVRKAVLGILLGVTGSVVALFQGCGPSAQAIYEGSVRFEHCYRLDLDKTIVPSHRAMCWREWMATYSYGQTSDRVGHARRRIEALEAGETSPPELNLDGGPTNAPAAPAEVPIPTSLHAPPPATAPAMVADSGPDSGEPVDAPSPLPRLDCQSRCEDLFRDCAPRLRPDAGAKAGSATACERDYVSCMRRCFK